MHHSGLGHSRWGYRVGPGYQEQSMGCVITISTEDGEQKYLFDRNRRFPRFLFVKNGQADGARRIDVGVEEGGCKFAWNGFKQHQFEGNRIN